MANDNEEQLPRAVSLIESELYDEAVALLRKFLEESPDSIEGWYNLGFALSNSGKEEEAVEAYDEALAIDNMIFAIWFNKATLLYDMADFDGAKECYEEALRIDPEDAEAWNNLGNAFSRLADGASAIEAYTRAVAIRPDYAEAFYNSANAHFIEGDDERAIACAEAALELDASLIKRVSQWIHVSRDRLASTRAAVERSEQRKRESED
ncbi:MAG: tetratricopeptide repeat protein [Candidatus Thorarchaeota archaeon]|jgi:superkiller protein 3